MEGRSLGPRGARTEGEEGDGEEEEQGASSSTSSVSSSSSSNGHQFHLEAARPVPEDSRRSP